MQKTNMLIGCLALVAVFAVNIAQAQDKTWIGETGDWNVSGNWDPSGVPGSTDYSVINSDGDVVTIQSGTNADSDQIDLGPDTGQAELHINGGTLNAGNFFPRGGSLFEIDGGQATVATFRDLSGDTANLVVRGGGDFTADNGNVRLGSTGGTGDSGLTVYSGAKVTATSNVGDNKARFWVGEDTAATVRTVLGRNHQSAEPLISIVNDPDGYESGLALESSSSHHGAPAHLEALLEGGVMLSPNSNHLLIDVENAPNTGSAITGEWTSAPGDNAGDLWNTTTGEQFDGESISYTVEIDLNTDVNRGTLDAGQPGSSSVSIADPAADGVKGYVEVQNLSTQVLALGLDFSDQKTTALLDEISSDLEAAGYNYATVGYGGYDLGLGVDWDSGSNGNFAFDFSEYTGSALELTSVTVVPEPSSLLLLGLAGLLLMNRRRR